MVGSVGALLDERVRLDGDRTALRFGDRAWSWHELDRLVDAFAARLLEAKVKPQQRVAYLGRNGPGCFVALLAAARVRAVHVPLNWRLTPGEVQGLLDDARPPVVVVDADLAATVEQWRDDAARAVAVLASESLWSETPAEPGPGVSLAPEPGDLAFLLYTSGTTGRPKGALFANDGNVVTLLERISPVWGFRPDDVSLVCMPLFHMGGLAWALAGMAGGAEALVVRDFEPVSVLDACERHGVTTAFVVPAMLTALLAVDDLGSRDLALRRLTYSGAPVAPSVLTAAMKLFGCDFAQIYGLTEATGAFAQLDPADHDPGGPRQHLLLSAGRAYPWVEVQVVDPLTEEPLPVGATGEIWTRSTQNLVGYFDRPEETAAALTADGWLRTGDVGLLDEHGYLFLRDRRKDMVISGGENVYPAEVEKVLADYPPALEVAVIGVPSERWGETVKAVVVPRPGHEIDAADLIAFTRERLAAFKCPTSVDVVDALPRTATGKVRKDVVREPYWAGRDRRIG